MNGILPQPNRKFHERLLEMPSNNLHHCQQATLYSSLALKCSPFCPVTVWHKRSCVSWEQKDRTVSGQNIIGIYIILLTLIQLTENKQNLICNNWWLKIQPAVILQNWSITAGYNSNNQLLLTRFGSLQPAVFSTSDCCKQYFVSEQ